MTKFAACMAHVQDTGLVYSIDAAGKVSTLSLATYESLRTFDPRLRRIAWSRRQAETTSLRVRGIETGFETPKRLEN
jgi:hypothetical protein